MHNDDFNELLRIQRMMAGRIIQETTVDNKIKLLDLVNKLVTDRNKKVQKEAIIYEAQAEGFVEDEILELIDELIDDGVLAESEIGYVQRA